MKQRSGSGPFSEEQPINCARLDTSNPAVLALSDDCSSAAEQYRNVALQVVEDAESSNGGFVLTVTSSEPATGKSLVSLNLCLTLARDAERKILLIEADLRKPTLRRYLEMVPERPGLWQILNGAADLELGLIPLWGTRLELLLAGTEGKVRNVLAQPAMTQALRSLRSRYPIILLDAPPLALAGGRSAAARADKVVLVARAGQTKKRDIEQAKALLSPQRTLGMVLNATTRPPRDAYSLYEGYGGAEAADATSLVSRARALRRTSILIPAALAVTGLALGFLWWSSRLAPVEDGHEGLAAARTERLLENQDPEPIAPTLEAAPGSNPYLSAGATEPDIEELSAPEPVAFPAVLEPEHGSQVTEPATIPANGTLVTIGRFNLRMGPSLDQQVIGTLAQGEHLEVLAARGSWRQVNAGGRVGWVHERSAVPSPQGESDRQAAGALAADPVAQSTTAQTGVAEAFRRSRPEPGSAALAAPDDGLEDLGAPSEPSAEGFSEQAAPKQALIDPVAAPIEPPAAVGEAGAAAEPAPVEAPQSEGLAVSAPKLEALKRPQFPPAARRLGLHGRVVVEVLVDEFGQVVEADVVQSVPRGALLDRAALVVARRAVFSPALRGDEPIKMRTLLTFEFVP